MRFIPAMLLLAAPASTLAQDSVHEFRLGGSAEIVSEECIRLTPDAPYVSGSAWYEVPVDLSEPFEVRLSLMLGGKDENGADGIVFVLHPSMTTGRGGEGMGFIGLAPSIGIEFDTYRNFHLDDPEADHLALVLNGSAFHGDRSQLVELENLEDRVRHPMRIVWNPGSGLRVFLDDTPRAFHSADLFGVVFDTRTVLYWGMTAGTGRLSNEQVICIEKLFLRM